MASNVAPRNRGRAQRDTEHEGHADAEQPEHEEPVDCGHTCERVERALERSDSDAREKARGRRSAVDPHVGARRRIAEAERLVEERPEEFEAECETKPEQSQRADSPAQRRDRRALATRREVGPRRVTGRVLGFHRRPRHSLERARQGCGGGGLERGGHVTQSRRAHVEERVPKVTSAPVSDLIPDRIACRAHEVRGLGCVSFCGFERLRRQGPGWWPAPVRPGRAGRALHHPGQPNGRQEGMTMGVATSLRPQGWKALVCGVAIAGAALAGSPAGAAPTVPGAPTITGATPGLAQQ